MMERHRDVNIRIGAQARALRLARGLTLRDVVERAPGPLSVALLSHLERGNHDWATKFVVRVCAALGVTSEELLSPELTALRARIDRAREALDVAGPPPEPPARAPPGSAAAA